MIGATGHQGIPSAAIPFVRDEILAALSPFTVPWIGVCSLAEGADQEFASMVLSLGGTLRIVLPSERYEETFQNAGELRRFQSLLSRADSVLQLDFPEPTEEAFFAAGRRIVDECDLLVAVWDGAPARGLGGTADIVDYARSVGRPVSIIWPSGVQR